MDKLQRFFRSTTSKSQKPTEISPLKTNTSQQANKSFFGFNVSWLKINNPSSNFSFPKLKLFGSQTTGLEGKPEVPKQADTKTVQEKNIEVTLPNPFDEKFDKAVEKHLNVPKFSTDYNALTDDDRKMLKDALSSNDSNFMILLRNNFPKIAINKYIDFIPKYLAAIESGEGKITLAEAQDLKISDETYGKYGSVVEILIKELYSEKST